MTLDLFPFTALTRWIKDFLAPPPKTHPPGRIAGAGERVAVPVEYDR